MQRGRISSFMGENEKLKYRIDMILPVSSPQDIFWPHDPQVMDGIAFPPENILFQLLKGLGSITLVGPQEAKHQGFGILPYGTTLRHRHTPMTHLGPDFPENRDLIV